jgi:hypothetical protein
MEEIQPEGQSFFSSKRIALVSHMNTAQASRRAFFLYQNRYRSNGTQHGFVGQVEITPSVLYCGYLFQHEVDIFDRFYDGDSGCF